ncbi:DNA-binding Lrp family transcriptional regulator [Propionibacteriaceae bacterium ES.041]|uniref:AsnC family protein n=1 Tax=Enemella evansiae TaxID=2016499 RepID=A0A255GP94_9ACTN|nr:Lrp/AsnC family transcriptional regulator [Enemella evansiae]OYO02924.1 AsnC family protein [Enemella evansiae]OYO12217.1 AsnC family protein [Enemella evansiae]OYO16376.1 AsnC family protein [Enemella evansiae]PFG69334.1 DNA-binding Lrp family transcriptional regulator [Propionibacteriaceae bacterium ES.041]
MTLPDRDRRILAALQLAPRATWRQIGTATGMSEQLVAQRGQQLLADGLVRVSGQVDHLRCGLGINVQTRLSCPPNQVMSVAEQLANDPQTRFVTVTAGGSDIFVQYVVRDHAALPGVLQRLPPVVTRADTAMVLRKFSAVEEWDSQVLDADARAVLRPDSGQVRYQHQDWTTPETLTDTEHAMIEILHRDGRASYAELSRQLGTSESTVMRRMDSLRRRGCLRFRALFDQALLGYPVEFLQLLTVEPSRTTAVGSRLAELPGSQLVCCTTGDSNLLVFGATTDYAALYDHVGAVSAEDGAVHGIDTLMITRTLKHAWIPVSAERIQLAPASESVRLDQQKEPA